MSLPISSMRLRSLASIATYLLANYKTFGGGFAAAASSYVLIALYIVLMSIISFAAVQFLSEYAGKARAEDEV